MRTSKLRHSDVRAEQADSFTPGQTQQCRLHTLLLSSVAGQPVSASLTHWPLTRLSCLPSHVFATHLPWPPPPSRLHTNALSLLMWPCLLGPFITDFLHKFLDQSMSTSFLSICCKSWIHSQKQNTMECTWHSTQSRAWGGEEDTFSASPCAIL